MSSNISKSITGDKKLIIKTSCKFNILIKCLDAMWFMRRTSGVETELQKGINPAMVRLSSLCYLLAKSFNKAIL